MTACHYNFTHLSHRTSRRIILFNHAEGYRDFFLGGGGSEAFARTLT